MTDEKNTREVFDEVFDEAFDENGLPIEEPEENAEPNPNAMDMETKNQQFDEDTEKALELLRNGDYFDTRSLLLSYNEVDIADIMGEIIDEVSIDKAIIAAVTPPRIR